MERGDKREGGTFSLRKRERERSYCEKQIVHIAGILLPSRSVDTAQGQRRRPQPWKGEGRNRKGGGGEMQERDNTCRHRVLLNVFKHTLLKEFQIGVS